MVNGFAGDFLWRRELRWGRIGRGWTSGADDGEDLERVKRRMEHAQKTLDITEKNGFSMITSALTVLQ